MTPMGMMSTFEAAKRQYPMGTLEREVIDRLEAVAVKAVYTENDQGGAARRVVAEVARVLGVDIDEGPGHRWAPEHMARVIARAAQVSSDREHWEMEAANERNEADRLREDLRQAREQRDAWKEAVETLEEKRVRPLGRELAELKAAHAECQARRRAERAASGRTVLHVEAGASPFVTMFTPAFRWDGRQHVPVNSSATKSNDVDELRAVIVSQAREIAKLKGESE